MSSVATLPTTTGNTSLFAHWRSDLPASIVVFLVALPLCMGIAIASGVPPAVGLITGIVGGLVVGTLAGSPLQVSGPAAGLSVMVYEIVQEVGIESLGEIVIIAGVIQILSGILHFGQWFRAVSPAVIRGMLAGIGILIFASQFHVMLDDSPKGNGLQNLLSIPHAIAKGVIPMDDSTHHWAAMTGIVTIIVLTFWKAVVPRRLKVIPSPLAAVVAGSVFAIAWQLPIQCITLPNTLFEAVTLPNIGEFNRFLDGKILLAGLALAFVASAETLLSANAVDQMHTGPRTKYDKELTAQGIGNTLCGLLGALPMTGVIVRSSANVEAGAKSRLSAILHGVWIVLFVMIAPFVLRMIPTACLAAILVFTGYKLVDIKRIRDLAQYGRGEVAIYAVTVILIVVSNLLTGVMVGIVLSAAKLLYTFSHLDVRIEDDFGRNRTILQLRGTATFIRLPQLAAALENVRPSTALHVHLERLSYIDHACLDLLMNWEKQHESTGGRLIIDWDNLTAKFHREEQESDEMPAVNLGLESRAMDRAAAMTTPAPHTVTRD